LLYPLFLRNWRMRWRVVALVVIPTAAAIALGTLRVQAAQNTSSAAARIEQLGVLGGNITALVEAIEDERDLTAGYVATRLAGMTPASGHILAELRHQYAVTGARLAAAQMLAGRIGPAFPAVARSDLTSALASVSALGELRGLAHTEMSALPLISHYSNVVATLLAFDTDIAAGSSSAQLAQTVTSFAALAQVEEEASQQRALLYATLLEGSFEPGALSALIGAQSSQASAVATFQKAGTNLPAFVPPAGTSPALTEAQQFNDTVTGPDIDAAQAAELDAIVSGGAGQHVSGDPQAWFGDMSFTLGTMRTVENDELGSVTAQARALQHGAANSRTLTAAVVLALLALVLFVTVIVARSLIRPLRKLRTDALEVAGNRLPDVVRRLSESQGAQGAGPEGVIRIEPIGIDSTDEIGEVARAFDRVHSEAVRLAGDEALLRANLNAMFVNLSRRSQSLIERQLSIIESLEQSEQDPDRLSSLFRLDHLATRMRRNSENLLVLAGHEAPRKWTRPVPLVDVLRAAISEIEQYDRIALNVQPGIVIAGRAASDVVHLAAELLENATAFSSDDAQVFVSGQLLTSGGVLVEITDAGLGIMDQELEYANWRLDHPPVIDVAVSRRMGLFVVGRLAARHGIKVRLRHAPAGGLSALIWLPEPVAEPETAPPLGTLRRRFDADGYQFSAPVSADRVLTAPAGGQDARAVQAPAAVADALARRSGPAEAEEPATAAALPSTAIPQLPIYDSVESDWFRRSGKPIAAGDGTPASSWASAADEGFRAAGVALSPTADDTTSAGLPRRVPSANLVPGSIGGSQAGQQADGPEGPRPASAPPPARRSPDVVRSRLADLQEGARRGRTDAPWNYGADES
jgi:signal transduction histidine kinase